LQQSVLAALKVMAKLDIAERRLQDGRISLQIGNQLIDVRVATIPSVEGESISLRLLGQEKFTLDRLRLEPDLRREVELLLKKPNGILLITGPTIQVNPARFTLSSPAQHRAPAHRDGRAVRSGDKLAGRACRSR